MAYYVCRSAMGLIEEGGRMSSKAASETGFREAGGGAGLVMHLRLGFGPGILCGTRKARAASRVRSEVNCVKCLARIASITGGK